MTWRVPRLWEGGECWILGGGPSLPRQFEVPEEVIEQVLSKELPLSAYSPYMASIHGKHVIGVNMAFLIGDWIDMLFFGDKKWYFTNRELVAKYRGLKVTCQPHFNKKKFVDEHIKFLAQDRNHPTGISANPHMVAWNVNSGAAAISVAVSTGVKRIILVGFDMRLDDNKRQHWHSEYGTFGKDHKDGKKLPFHRHILGFPKIAKEAKALGVEIINASPDSAIEDFPKISVKELVNGRAQK